MEEKLCMELTLVRKSGSQILVSYDNQPSHIFDLLTLIPNEKDLPQPLDDPEAYGKAVYHALFPPDTPTRRTLDNAPERILLITTDDDLDAVPWEYASGPNGFLALEYHFVRGLPVDQCIDHPILDSELHIVAVPSNPLDKSIPALNTDGEWLRLRDLIQQVSYAITLERTRPPTIEKMRHLLAHHAPSHCTFHGAWWAR